MKMNCFYSNLDSWADARKSVAVSFSPVGKRGGWMLGTKLGEEDMRSNDEFKHTGMAGVKEFTDGLDE